MSSEKLTSPGRGTSSSVPHNRGEVNSYDEVPYESHPYPQTHPSRLATIAALFGLSQPDVAKCRVLELGCAAGGNLIPMAEALPGGRFTGVDLSARQIGAGQRMIRTLGLENIDLVHAGISAIDDSYGTFDFVICHGVFSWVPQSVQQEIMEVCANRLAPTGVAYVSYNTYPGWHMRGMIRDMMRYHALRFDTPAERVRQARALLDFLAQSARKDGGAYAALLRSELDALKHQADHYLYHEHLEDVNSPLYFHEFVELAEKHGLRYLGESRIATMVAGNFTPEVQKALETVAADQVQAEQYLDFVRNRTFRETLLVPAASRPCWDIAPNAICGLHLALSHRVSHPAGDIKTSGVVQYQSRTGMVLSTSSPPLKAAMRILSERWPGTISFAELSRQVRDVLEDREETSEALALGLLNTYLSADLLDLHAVPLVTYRAGEMPLALPSIRARMEAGENTAANRRHEVFRPSELDRKLLPLLDGTRNHQELLACLTKMALAGELTVQSDGRALTEPDAIETAFKPVLENALASYGESALLLG